ncbi:MAG: radical SAM protein [Deltaproteobacteria bacterium]|uniref:Radical SAM protein n=1 Tax=Candidatus Desulfacyla euxinica TaxID=2841693 RepID=A0A8J6T246_9DELT|nr:radical SAM protein [Candidatus Desulfacyla euxinica]
MKPLIIPIFISHSGCPHRCIFCDQEKITSQSVRAVGSDYVRKVLEKAISSKRFDIRRNPEVAFYGGTFTGLPKDRMTGLLEAVSPYIRDRFINSIRVSTRPDFIDEERLKIMKAFHVRTVELGVQSLDEEVLSMAQRGHTAGDVIRAVQMLKRGGFKVGIQLMPGLPGDSEERFRATIEKVIGLNPDMVRLYPALVIEGTGLARMYAEGSYRPLTLEKAVNLCAQGVARLEVNGIPVIRIGLMSSPSLLEERRIVSGPWHTAFGFLVRSAIHQKAVEPDLPASGTAEEIRIFAPAREISLIRGYKNRGIRIIEEKTGAKVLGITVDDNLPGGRVRIEKI